MFHGWWIVGVAMLTQAVSTGLAIYSYGLLVVPIGTEFGASRMEMMWGKTGLSLMTMMVSPLLGTLLDCRSTRALMVLGSLALGSAFLWISVSRTLWEFVFAFAVLPAAAVALLGAASGGLMPGWTALLARLYGPMHYGRVMGRMLLVTGIMATMIVPLVGFLFDRSGDYDIAFLCLALLVLAATLLLAPMRKGNRPAPVAVPPAREGA